MNRLTAPWRTFPRRHGAFPIPLLTPPAVAARPSPSVNAVLLAQSRVMARLRREAEGLVG